MARGLRRFADSQRLVLLAVLAMIWLPTAAMAQQTVVTQEPIVTLPAPPFTLPFLPPISGDWTVSVGAGGEYKPDFEGAKRYMLSPVPVFSIHRAGSPDQFRSPRDSAGISFLDMAGFRLGPAAKYVAPRTATDFAELRGLGDVNAAIELGGFLEYFPVNWLRGRVEVLQGFGGQHGVVANFSGDFILPVAPQWTLSGGPRFTAQSTAATAPYFSVNLAQAMVSGLPAFNARGGAHSAGAGAQLRYQYNPQWEIHTYVEYERLLGDAAASPLVQQRGSPNQVTVGLGASYSFNVRVK
jgi:outer membrane protein